MQKIIKFLDKYVLLILWLTLLISFLLNQGDMLDKCIIMLFIINENIEKIRKGE